MKKALILLTLLFFCQPPPAMADPRGPVSWITEQVLVGLRQNMTRPVHRHDPILATSFVNLGNMDQGSPLGIMLGEYVAVGLTRYGYKVVEMRLDQSNMLIKPQTGEYILSRHLEMLRNSWAGKVILTGTYSLAPDNRLYVTAKLINSEDSTVLSSTLVTVRATKALTTLYNKQLEVRSIAKPSKPEEKESIAEEPILPPQNPYASGTIFLSLNVRDDVRRVQGRLKDLGLYTGKIDGKWGKRSQHALKLFKSVSQLPNPDTWDMETQKKLFYN